MSTTAMFQQALEVHRAGKLADAESLYRAILAQEPQHAQALHFLGVLHHQRGEHQTAVEFIEQSLAANPNNAEAHNNLGSVMTALGDAERAYRCFQIAVQLNPAYPEAQNNLAGVLLRAGRRREALHHFEKALSFRANYPAAWNGIGEALGGEGETDKAAECFSRAIALAPDFAAAHYNLAVAHRIRGDLNAAVESYHRAIESSPGYFQSHSNLSAHPVRARETDRRDRARAKSHRARAARIGGLQQPRQRAARDWTTRRCARGVSKVFRTFAERSDGSQQHSLRASLPRGVSPRTKSPTNLQAWNARHAAKFAESIAPHTNDRAPDRRLRIGYVSGDFPRSSSRTIHAPLLRGHDREQFEIFCYSNVARPDHVTAALASHASQWRDVTRVPDETLAEQIRADRIDILVDLSGHTAENRLLVFARKPAPVQLSYLGYPDDTGLETIDARLTDRIADPEDDERLVRVECAWCYEPIDDAPDVSHSSDAPITFACFNNFAKVSEELIQMWSQILHAVPDSRLLIKAQPIADDATRAAVHEHLVSFGLPKDRVEVLPRTPSLRDHMAMYNSVDIALDTFPYHGTTTTGDALWMGVPVITLAGDKHVSRVGASLLAACGVADLVAQNSEQYVELVTNLANDRARLTQLHESLREQMKISRLMNAHAYVRDIERAYRQTWRRWCDR
jgi:predicted O-linked N-acetylglucosamine transferase (SPINDLY family)